MGKLDQAVAIVGIANTIVVIYDGHVKRKRDAENDEKDRKIRDLEARLAKLEEKGR